jgi:hypothetical protein
MKILIGSPVRQDEKTFIEYLKGIDNLLVPKDAQVARYFILNDADPALKKHLQPHEYEEYNTGDDYICTEQTHYWSPVNLSKMSILRNRLLKKVLDEGYDWFFMVDSDIILQPTTLMQLLSDKVDMVANIFWTEGEPGSKSFWPNCWDYDQCSFDNAHKWINPGLYEIGGSGACFLISRKVLEAGVDYTPIHNIRAFHGEDRWFCIRAVCAGFKIYVDTHRPVTHLYRPSVYEEYMKLRYPEEAVKDGHT